MQEKSLARCLRSFQNRRPFRPFIVEFVDGNHIVVEYPEAVRYDGKGTAVHFGKHGALALFDHEGVSRVTNIAPARAEA